MGDSGFDVVVVRRSGPVSAMKFRSWWLYFLFLVLLVMLAGLGAGSYLLYRQHQAIQAISGDTRLLMLRAERLESLAQEQETLALLAQQAADQKAALEKPTKPDKKAKSPEPEKKAAAAAASEAPPTTTEPALPAEPKQSENVGIRVQQYNTQSSEIKITFDVTNQTEGPEPAMGYVTVVLRGSRDHKPWIEAWPPMRLTPLGRPLNYRRGTPFSVQRYRRLHASFAKGDKKVDRLEFLVYDRQGDLMLVKDHLVGAKDQAKAKPQPGGKE